MVETKLAKAVGQADAGTPVVVIGEVSYDPDILRCVLNGKVRLLFRDEVDLFEHAGLV